MFWASLVITLAGPLVAPNPRVIADRHRLAHQEKYTRCFVSRAHAASRTSSKTTRCTLISAAACECSCQALVTRTSSGGLILANWRTTIAGILCTRSFHSLAPSRRTAPRTGRPLQSRFRIIDHNFETCSGVKAPALAQSAVSSAIRLHAASSRCWQRKNFETGRVSSAGGASVGPFTSVENLLTPRVMPECQCKGAAEVEKHAVKKPSPSRTRASPRT